MQHPALSFALRSVEDNKREPVSTAISAEIVEIKEKSSVYMYSIYVEQLNDELQCNDRGFRLRALCAIGEKGINIHQLQPVDDGIVILGATDKVLILDISDANSCYQVGESLGFYHLH